MFRRLRELDRKPLDPRDAQLPCDLWLTPSMDNLQASPPNASERHRLLTSLPRLVDAVGSLLALAHSPAQSPRSHHLPRRPSPPIQASLPAALTPPADQD